jgi:hypothetical protein
MQIISLRPGLTGTLKPQSTPATSAPLFQGEPAPAVRTRVTHELELNIGVVPHIKSGAQTGNIRYGYTFIDAPQITFKPISNGQPAGKAFQVDFLGIDIVPFSKVTKAQANSAGFKTVREFQNGMRGYYGQIPDDYPMTVIRFSTKK